MFCGWAAALIITVFTKRESKHVNITLCLCIKSHDGSFLVLHEFSLTDK